MRSSATMVVMLVVVSVQTTQADIGEKLRLGQPIKRVPQDNFGAALSATGIGAKNIGPHHDYDENNLDRLCNDPFHSFLCKPVGPRKNRLDGRLRPGAILPNSVVLSGSSSNLQELKTNSKLEEEPLKTGGAILSSGIEPASSINAPGSFAMNNNDGGRPESGGYLPPVIPSQTQQVFTTQKQPSKEYLPINSNPIPIPQDNFQIPLPLEQPQQTVIRYTPVTAPQQTNIPFSSTSFLIKPPQPQNLVPPTTFTTFQPQQQLITTPLLNSFPIGSSSIIQPSNQYLPIAPQPLPIDIRVSPASTNLSPLVEGGAILAEGRQESPAELRQQTSNEGGRKHSERQHTLEELCNDAFHSFLCQPITKPRKRIDGNIRPGAKIPPHVLQGAHSFDSSGKKLLPLKEGSAILAEGREPDRTGHPQGYVYPNPQNPLLLYSQATNIPTILPNIQPSPPVVLQSASPSTNVALPTIQNQQFLIRETIIPPAATFNLIPANNVQIPVVQTFANTIQKPLQNLQYQATFIKSQKIPISTTPRPVINNKGNPFAAASAVQRNDNSIEVFKRINQNEGQSSKQIDGYTYPKPAGIPLSPVISSSAQLAPEGYNYPKPNVPFTLPTSTIRTQPISTPNILYIPSFNEAATTLVKSQNQIVTTTELPTAGPTTTTTTQPKSTDGYVYQTPSIPFPLPSQILPSSENIQTAQSANNQPILITTSNKSEQPNSPVPGYLYPRPAKPFTLPPTKVSSTKDEGIGYSYPKPDVGFTLPPRQPSTNIQQFGYKLTPITTKVYNELTPTITTNDVNLPVTKIITTGNAPADPLPPASQFEIIKP